MTGCLLFLPFLPLKILLGGASRDSEDNKRMEGKKTRGPGHCDSEVNDRCTGVNLAGDLCNDCKCLDCNNTLDHLDEVERAKQEILDKNPEGFEPKVRRTLC